MVPASIHAFGVVLLRVLISVLAVLALTFPAAAATLEQMAGQMIVVGFEGDGADDDGVEAVTAELATGRLGGVMYLKKNVADLASVREMNARFRAAAPDLPAFITLDQEGGS